MTRNSRGDYSRLVWQSLALFLLFLLREVYIEWKTSFSLLLTRLCLAHFIIFLLTMECAKSCILLPNKEICSFDYPKNSWSAVTLGRGKARPIFKFLSDCPWNDKCFLESSIVNKFVVSLVTTLYVTTQHIQLSKRTNSLIQKIQHLLQLYTSQSNPTCSVQNYHDAVRDPKALPTRASCVNLASAVCRQVPAQGIFRAGDINAGSYISERNSFKFDYNCY